jgi:hypothetical protein
VHRIGSRVARFNYVMAGFRLTSWRRLSIAVFASAVALAARSGSLTSALRATGGAPFTV